MLKTLSAAVLAIGLLAEPAHAMDTVVTGVDRNTDGTMTYHFAVRTAPGETLTPGNLTPEGDFFTLYNFYGLVEGSAKSPPGWEVTSEDYGRTPFLNGYPVVAPVDIAGTPNLTWTVTKPVAGGAQIDGFQATTRMAETVMGQYTAQVTRQIPVVQGAPAGTPFADVHDFKQAIIGLLPAPSFLADVK